MLDQSPQQLSKARVKPELQRLAAIVEGDAENLPANWSGVLFRVSPLFSSCRVCGYLGDMKPCVHGVA